MRLGNAPRFASQIFSRNGAWLPRPFGTPSFAYIPQGNFYPAFRIRFLIIFLNFRLIFFLISFLITIFETCFQTILKTCCKNKVFLFSFQIRLNKNDCF